MVERMRPFALEINRVDEHKARGGVDHARWQEVGDFIFRLGGDPVIDFFARGFGVGAEIVPSWSQNLIADSRTVDLETISAQGGDIKPRRDDWLADRETVAE